MPRTRLITGVVGSLVLSATAQAATIYVNSKATCKLPTTTCGTATVPFKLLGEALTKAKPGDEIVLQSQTDGTPYYAVDPSVALPTQVGQEVANFSALSVPAGSTATTLIRGSSATNKPIIRGTLPVKGWTLVSSTGGYLYSRPWTLTQWGSSKVIEPQQVFRNTLAAGQQGLKQIGGKVFGGYYPGVNPSTIDPDLQAGLAQNPDGLWLGYTPFNGTAAMGTNQFYFDAGTNTLYVKLATALGASEALEVGAMQFVLQGNGVNRVTLRNLVIERSNTSFFWRGGALQLNGSNTIVEGVDFREGDSYCAAVSGNNNIVRNNTFTRCGQVGLGGNGNAATISGNTFTANNARYFNPFWEAGPTKFIGGNALTNSTISGNVVLNNRGHGIWLDTHNNNNVIDGNVVAGNLIGILLEVSNGNTVKNNVVFGNSAQGVQLRGGAGTNITSNLMVSNGSFGVFMTPVASVGEVAYQFKPLDPSKPGSTNAVVNISGNTMAWHEEATGNRTPVLVVPTTTLSSNRYCGVATGDGSMHYWLQDWNPDPAITWANNVFGWASWRAAKASPTNPTAPAYDTVGSVQQLTASVPTTVAAWPTRQADGTATAAVQSSLAQYAGNTTNIATTRSNLLTLVNGSCK